MAKHKANKVTAETLVKAFKLPKMSPQRVHSDLWGFDEAPFKPPIPLMPQYLRGAENWIVDTPRLSRGYVSIKRVASNLDMSSGERFSGTLLPNQQVVILRPYDLRVEQDTGLIAEMVDDFTTHIDARFRLHLPKSVVSTLNLVSTNEFVLLYGQKFQFTNGMVKRASGEKNIPILYLFNPSKFRPEGLEDELTW